MGPGARDRTLSPQHFEYSWPMHAEASLSEEPACTSVWLSVLRASSLGLAAPRSLPLTARLALEPAWPQPPRESG